MASKPLTIEVEHLIGDRVRLITDPEKAERMVARLFVSSLGVMYELACGANDTLHYAMEIEAVPKEEKRSAGFVKK